jgi:hypothetical protein
VVLALGLHCYGEHPRVSIPKIVWRGSGASTLSVLTMAILQKLATGPQFLAGASAYRVSLSDMLAVAQRGSVVEES